MTTNISIARAAGATHAAGEGPEKDFSGMSVTELLEASKTLMCARHVFALQATRYRAHGGSGGEVVQGWAAHHLQRLDAEVFAIVQELDNRDLVDEDESLERDIAIRESFDVLPIEAPFEVNVTRRAHA